MTLRLNGSTSGYTEIDAPAVAGSNTLVLPTGNGSAGNILGTDGSGNLSWVNGRMVLATAQNSTSGTSVEFTGIPSWVKRITVMFNGVSASGTSNILVQIGTSGGVVATGYTASSSSGASAVGTTSVTVGFNIRTGAGTDTIYGSMIISNISSNAWVSNHSLGSALFYVGGGSITLSGTLDRVRITTVNGTDTFDAGSINILYEG
jgi:hypothetical protein